jgi:hypothetical protein
MIVLTKAEWAPIWELIKTEYPRSVWMVSWGLRRELGFTIRMHRDLTKKQLAEGSFYDDGMPRTMVCLDFYDHQMEVYFRLKYL